MQDQPPLTTVPPSIRTLCHAIIISYVLLIDIIIIIIIIDIFKVAYTVKTITRTTVLGWQIMTRKGECN